MICADEREADSPPSFGQSRPCAPWRASGCYGGRLGSVSPSTGTTYAPPTGENHSLGHSWVCVGVRETDQRGDWGLHRRNQDCQKEVCDRESQEGQYNAGK